MPSSKRLQHSASATSLDFNESEMSSFKSFLMILVFIGVIIKTIIIKTIVFSFRFLKRIFTGKEHECKFCHLHKQDDDLHTIVLFRDEVCYIVEDIRPEAEFHYLVVPFKHTPTMRTISNRDDLHLGKLVHLLAFINIQS